MFILFSWDARNVEASATRRLYNIKLFAVRILGARSEKKLLWQRCLVDFIAESHENHTVGIDGECADCLGRNGVIPVWQGEQDTLQIEHQAEVIDTGRTWI